MERKNVERTCTYVTMLRADILRSSCRIQNSEVIDLRESSVFTMKRTIITRNFTYNIRGRKKGEGNRLIIGIQYF